MSLKSGWVLAHYMALHEAFLTSSITSVFDGYDGVFVHGTFLTFFTGMILLIHTSIWSWPLKLACVGAAGAPSLGGHNMVPPVFFLSFFLVTLPTCGCSSPVWVAVVSLVTVRILHSCG